MSAAMTEMRNAYDRLSSLTRYDENSWDFECAMSKLDSAVDKAFDGFKRLNDELEIHETNAQIRDGAIHEIIRHCYSDDASVYVAGPAKEEIDWCAVNLSHWYTYYRCYKSRGKYDTHFIIPNEVDRTLFRLVHV